MKRRPRTEPRARFHDPSVEQARLSSAGQSFEMSQFAKDLEAGIDLLAGQRLQAFGAETLHGERSHHTAIEEASFQDLAVQLFLGGDISHESSGEGVARASWILDFLDGQS